jgi:alpha-aminoadipate carrier protein LysW
MAECPVCAAEVSIANDALAGEVLACDDCGVELEIIALEPIKLAEAPTAEEDWGQ